MKLFENSFDCYLKKMDDYNLHLKLDKIYKKFPDDLS